MQINSPLNKGFSIVVIAVFIGISIIPSIGGNVVTFDEPPQITNVMLTTSDPLDTEPGFGWENFSCTVTDDVGVNTVKVIITYPYGTILEHTMTNILGTDMYYYDTAFTDAGYYMYSIWADDAEGNTAISNYQIFVLPMNEDIDMSGCVDWWDAMLLSQVPLGWEGPPGWIREDINNNGLIDFIDGIQLSLHMGECLPPPPWENLPEITNVMLTTSDPLDTEPGFGWENFSCTVTSDGTLDIVQLNLTLTGVWGDTYYYYFPMTNILGTDVYYYNTTLTDPGDYTYHIWANDTNGNQNSTLPEPFFLPTNEDVDMSGMAHFMDLIAIARHYNEEGPPGWIREDVDNNGEVHFMDLIAIVRHYGEKW